MTNLEKLGAYPKLHFGPYRANGTLGVKCSFGIKNLILKMNDYDFLIQDFVQGCPFQILIF